MLRATFSTEDIIWVLDVVKRELEVEVDANQECVFKDKYIGGLLLCIQHAIISLKNEMRFKLLCTRNCSYIT